MIAAVALSIPVPLLVPSVSQKHCENLQTYLVMFLFNV